MLGVAVVAGEVDVVVNVVVVILLRLLLSFGVWGW